MLGPDTGCPYYPCHFEGQDCTWCYCPFYPCEEEAVGGRYVEYSEGGMIWSCKDCHWIHRREVAEAVLRALKKLSDFSHASLLKVMRRLLEEYPP
ncbi:MAG: hypothetical protein J7L98_06730 [Candidatus Verstraetearchaeota archaeon]|nr:hypothetical protein [Candidatus Verstraetearchaeota archaeon]